MKSLKHYYSWLSEQEEEGFSSQLLRLLRDSKGKIDIRDVRELLHLGADPNYKLLGHSDEEQIEKFIDVAREEEWDLKEVPRVMIYKMATLAYPISKHSPEVLSVMLEYGADPNLDFSDVTMASGSATPFVYAVTQTIESVPNSMKVLDLLIDAGADVNATDSYGNNALHRAISSRKFFIIKKLVDIGVDPFKKNRNGNMPIDLIDNWGKYEINGEMVLGSEVRNMFKDLLEKPEEPKKQKFSIFRKNK